MGIALGLCVLHPYDLDDSEGSWLWDLQESFFGASAPRLNRMLTIGKPKTVHKVHAWIECHADAKRALFKTISLAGWQGQW